MSINQNTEVKDFNATIDSIRQELAQGFQPSKQVTQAVLRVEGFSHAGTAEATQSQARSSVAMQLANLAAAMGAGSASVALDNDGKARDTGISTRFKLRSENHVKENAFQAFALANDPNTWGGRTLAPAPVGHGKASTVMSQGQGMSGGYAAPRLRQEAFREIDTHATVAYSMGYGASITRHTDFVMGWYPPIMMSPDQTVLEVKLNLLTVFNGIVHDTETGNMVNFMRRNVARAFENPHILNRYATLAMPIYTAGRAEHFVPASVAAPRDIQFGNRVINTTWLKFENDCNVHGLATTAATLDSQGAPTHREALEPGTKVDSILIKSGDDVIKLPLLNLRTMNFVGAQQWDQQETILNGNVTLGLSGSKLVREDGSALTGPLKALADNKLRISVQLKMSGSINIESGNMNLPRPTLRLVSVESIETGEVYDKSNATFQAIDAAIKATTSEGYMVRPFKTNSTKREQGDRLNSRRFVFQYMVPYRDPITVERQINNKGENDAQDLTNLMGLTKIRIENEAVDHMFEMFDLMEQYIDMNANDGTLNDLPGLAQFYIIPCFHKETLKLQDLVDSTKSHERAEDIQSYLVMKLRDVVTRLLTFSQWKAGMIMQNNDTLAAPQVNIATNPILARYLLAPGDMRTLGDYDYVVTTTLNRRLADKMAISFRIPGQEASNEVQIFGWGHLLTTAEVVFAANILRNSDYFAELQVQPRYDFMPMNLTGALITVTGIPEVLGKIPGYTKLAGPLSVESTIVADLTTAP